jgi:transposase-like protein
MAKRKRRKHTNEQKAEILRRHLVDKVAVSDLCDEYKIQPSVFYGWQKQLMDNLATAVEATSGQSQRRAQTKDRELTKKVKKLEADLQRKEHVIAEISEEYVALKKELGEL